MEVKFEDDDPITKVLGRVAGEDDATDEDGRCTWCGLWEAHKDDCIRQVARRILGLPLLKTEAEQKAEEQAEADKRAAWVKEHACPCCGHVKEQDYREMFAKLYAPSGEEVGLLKMLNYTWVEDKDDQKDSGTDAAGMCDGPRHSGDCQG